MIEIATGSPEETAALGEALGRLLSPGDVLGLSGPLGGGKTVLVRGLARGLGVNTSFRVVSPTFVYAQVYPGKITLYHIDYYRIEDESVMKGLGLDEMIGTDGVAAVEWFDRFPSSLPDDALTIDVRYGPGDNRRFRVTGDGGRWREVEPLLRRAV